ncbi:MAG: hypothetical protein ABI837_12720 [Acidobacteriota bacterium]
MVISDQIDYPALYEALQRAEEVIARPVNPTVMKRAEWKRKTSGGDSFAARVAAQPKIFIVGSKDDVA